MPFIGFITGFGFASFGVVIAAVAKTIDNFNYVTGLCLSMFLVAGTFFPISTFPPLLHLIAELNPLYHCVQLVRDRLPPSRAPRCRRHRTLAVLVGFALLMWRLAIVLLGRRLID